jgi:hypothetical protein
MLGHEIVSVCGYRVWVGARSRIYRYSLTQTLAIADSRSQWEVPLPPMPRPTGSFPSGAPDRRPRRLWAAPLGSRRSALSCPCGSLLHQAAERYRTRVPNAAAILRSRRTDRHIGASGLAARGFWRSGGGRMVVVTVGRRRDPRWRCRSSALREPRREVFTPRGVPGLLRHGGMRRRLRSRARRPARRASRPVVRRGFRGGRRWSPPRAPRAFRSLNSLKTMCAPRRLIAAASRASSFEIDTRGLVEPFVPRRLS